MHLHVHTDNSLLDGMCNISELLDQAKKFGMRALAVTDHGNLYGAIEFYRAATSPEVGINPIIGIEAYVAPGDRRDRTPDRRGGGESSHHLTLLAANEIGYRNLCKLSTISFTEGFYYKPRIDFETLSKHNEGIICLSGCPASEFGSSAVDGNFDRAMQAAKRYCELFGRERYFLEVQNHGMDIERKIVETAAQISKHLGLKIVATNDCHYIRKDDHEAHDVMLALSSGTTIKDEKRLKFCGPEFYLKTHEQMLKAFGDFPEWLDASVGIAEKCNTKLSVGGVNLPSFDTGGQPANVFLREMCERNMRKKFGDPPQQHVVDRLNLELGVISSKGFDNYFLIVQDFIIWARANGIMVGPGRGSAAGSLVAYLLDITQLNPFDYGLLFERFLNPERNEMPDIDVDFEPEQRERVIGYIRNKYGADKVSHIITYAGLRARLVIRDVARALEVNADVADQIAKGIPHSQILDIKLRDAYDKDRNLREFIDKRDDVKKLWNIALKLEGLKRHTGKHAGGIVISDTPLAEKVPLYKSTKDDDVITQFDMESIAALGLLKVDILGVETLTAIKKTFEQIKKSYGTELSIENIPHDDEKTFKMLADGHVKGVFQLEVSQSARDMMKRMKPTKLDHLMHAVALNRPGPLQSGMVDEFLKCMTGAAQVKKQNPILDEILTDTYGTIVYQEQVMLIAHKMAGFTLAEADKLRKAMGKKDPEIMEKNAGKLLNGLIARGVDPDLSKELVDGIKKFCQYAFNKSHSAAYGLISYITAYLKANYTKEFMASLMSTSMNDHDRIMQYVEECRKFGIQVLDPDVNLSEFEFSVEETSIRYGLGSIKNLGEKAGTEIIRARRAVGGKFRDLFHFLESIDKSAIDRRNMENLIKCGGLKCFGMKMSVLLENLDRLLEFLERKHMEKTTGQLSIFGEDSAQGFSFSDIPELSRDEILSFQKELLGAFLQDNPLYKYETICSLLSNTNLEGIADAQPEKGSRVSVVCLMTEPKMKAIHSGARKGSHYATFRIYDLTASCEVVMFSTSLDRFKQHLKKDEVVFVEGERDYRAQNMSIIVNEVLPLNLALQAKTNHYYIKAPSAEPDIIEAIKRVLSEFKGEKLVFLRIPEGTRVVTVKAPRTLYVNPTVEFISRMEEIVGRGNISVTMR